LNISAKFH